MATRSSTPTDAAKMVVPDVAEEIDRITRLRDRARQVMSAWLAQQQHREHRGGPAGSPALPGHPLRPLRATPSTMFRWARMKSTIAGTLAIAAPAITTG